MMKTKILIILIILIGLGVGGFFVYKNISVPEVEKEELPMAEEKTEKEVYIYKGIWLPTLMFQDSNHLVSNVQKLKDIGINTVFIQASPPQSEQWLEKLREVAPLELVERVREILPSEKELIITNIQTAHRNGLKVALTISTPPGIGGIDLDLEALNSKVIEYARLAEEYDAELFAPMNEAGKILLENTGKWRQEILHRIKEVYHGDVVWKGAGVGLPDKELSKKFLRELSEGPPGDFVGYDYMGFSSMLPPEGQTLKEYSQYVEDVLKYELALAKRDGVKGVMITEFGVSEGGPWNEEKIARAHEIVLEKGEGKVFGFIVLDFLEVKLPGVSLFKEEAIKTEEVIKRWFTEILK